MPTKTINTTPEGLAVEKAVEKKTAGEILVKAEHVSKVFCRDLKKSLYYGVRDVVGEFWPASASSEERLAPPKEDGSDLRPEEFWALNNVSFELRRGQCLGLIGRNGAGKTTLLKMLNGLIKPDRGRITMNGRVGALIALNAGFNPILTGRENIYVNGSVLGLAKSEIDEKFDEIVEFSELSDFIDTPVQSYSSGMQVRLGFSVATALRPDVLLIDEVLAVGDASFRAKCMNRLAKIQAQAAVILVSHNEQVLGNLSDFGLYLHKGKIVTQGDIKTVLMKYADASFQNIASLKTQHFVDKPITHLELQVAHEITIGDKLPVTIKLCSTQEYKEVLFRAIFYDAEEQFVGEYNSLNADDIRVITKGESTYLWEVPCVHIRPGMYRVEFLLHNKFRLEFIYRSNKSHSIRIKGYRHSQAPYVIGG